MRPDEPLILWDWTFNHLPDIWQRLQEHLILTGIAITIGFVIAFALSLAIRQIPVLYAPVTWFTGVLYTIPSLALFSLLIPFTGLSILTAEIGLVGYTLLILVRNIVTGVDQVPTEVREAAIGMGFTRRRLLLQVELPLALPVVIAGLRVAAVTTIGLVTVTSMLGMGGLGFFIRAGIQTATPNPTAIIVGIGLSVVLAVVVDLLLWLSERALAPWARKART
jgi:osmoprotectant transport system permease protein